MAVMDRVVKGVLGVAGGVVGIVIVNDLIQAEVGTQAEVDDGNATIVDTSIAGTVLDYFVPLMLLGLLAAVVAIWRF